MERESDNADRIFKTRRISHWITMKLKGDYEVNRNSKRSYEKII